MKIAQSCPTLCNLIDYLVHGILQAKILEWVPSPGDLPNPGNEPKSPTLQADSLPVEPLGNSNIFFKKGTYNSIVQSQNSRHTDKEINKRYQ